MVVVRSVSIVRRGEARPVPPRRMPVLVECFGMALSRTPEGLVMFGVAKNLFGFVGG